VNIKSKIREKLIEVYGDQFNSYLEKIYVSKITENLINGDFKSKYEWLTYNQVILELKHNLKDSIKVKELQYKLTDNQNPNNVCVEVIRDVSHLTPELSRLYNKIMNF
jgi:hypothetical protein